MIWTDEDESGVLRKCAFGAGDVVEIYLDVEDAILEYVVNGKTSFQIKNILFDDGEDSEYCMAVYNCVYGSAIQLIGFNKIVKRRLDRQNIKIQ